MADALRPLALIVDDEEVFLEIASARLSAAGFDVVQATAVTEAIQKAERMLPAVVLSDIYMPPGPSGWELALALRRNQKTRSIKFAFFSSLQDPWAELQGDREAVAAELGPVPFLNKSMDTAILAERIWTIIRS